MSAHDYITAYAKVLFLSSMSPDDEITRLKTNDVMIRAFRAFGGLRGCAAAVAHEYGTHPDSASQRMRWARSVLAEHYSTLHRPSQSYRALWNSPARR
jgi:hypothetical protein